MVDFFLLLMLTGAGDELQGIKRGIMEMADAIAITKADGSNKTHADNAMIMYSNAMNLFPPNPSGWKPAVVTCSAHQNSGICQIWDIINDYVAFTTANGYFSERRKQQSLIRMNDTIADYLNYSFYNNKEIKILKPILEKRLNNGKITSYKAALALIDKYGKVKGAKQ